MEKKPLICGSGVAVVVLILASLGSVIGYNSVESSVKDSPLFSVRTSRTISQESDALRCEYLGKGKLCNLPLPKRNNQIKTVLEVIDFIRKMDDETSNKFVEAIAYRYRERQEGLGFSLEAIVAVLNQVRENAEDFKNRYIFIENRYYLIEITQGFICFILVLLCDFFRIFLLVLICTILDDCTPTEGFWCPTVTCEHCL